MTRTPEQLAADDGLAKALQECNDAYGFTGLIVGTLTICAVVEYDDAGDQCSGTIHHVPSGQHWITTLGVLDAGRIRLRSMYGDNTEEN